MVIKTQGIVLHTTKYSDNNIIVFMYTLHLGRCSFIIHGIHSTKSKYKIGLFQPLSILDIEISHSPKRELQQVKDVALQMVMVSIPGNVVKSTIALFIGDVLSRVLREEENNEQLFNFLAQSIKLLETMTEGVADFHVVFLANLSKHLGFFPDNNFSETSKFFDGKLGMFVPHKSTHCLDTEESRLLSRMLEADFIEMGNLHLNKSVRHLFLQIMIDFYSLHIPNFKNLHSLKILHEVFA